MKFLRSELDSKESEKSEQIEKVKSKLESVKEERDDLKRN